MIGAIISAVVSVAIAIFNWMTGKKTSDAKRAGRTEQGQSDLQATTRNVEEARHAEDTVRAASDDERERMRQQWTKPPSTGSGGD